MDFDCGSETLVPQKHCLELHIILGLMGRKSDLDVKPHLVCWRLLTDLGAGAGRFRGEFGWDPGFKREQRFLDAALQAEHALHCPGEVVAPTDAYRLSVLEIGA